MFQPEENESKTAGAANNFAEGPEPDILVETRDSSVVILYPNFEIKYFPIFKLSIGIKLQWCYDNQIY